MVPKLTTDQLRAVADELLGTAGSIQGILESMGLDSNAYDICEIEDSLLDYNVERCQCCDWWCESSELVSDGGEQEGICEDCR